MSENFNYIAFGNRALVEGDVDEISMYRGRMFEYTPPEVANGLESLDQEALSFLESIPTFLCSEITSEYPGASMVVRYGRINSTIEDKREVTTHFQTILNFGEVRFESVAQAQELFGADGFQMYRTHWAVRSGNVEELLTRLVDLSPRTPNELVELRKSTVTQASNNPPERKKNIIGAAKDVESFLRILQELPTDASVETFYRGHEDTRYELNPSLLRRWPDGAWQFLPNEDTLCKELLIAHYDDFQGDQYCFDRLVRMQHYGLPTRLLDISSNSLVALFFACFGQKDSLSNPGEVVVIRVAASSVKYYDSDTVSCISNLSNLKYSQKNDIDLTLDISAFNTSNSVLKLLHHIRSEKGSFESRIAPDDLGSIVCVKAKRTNSRIQSQSGAFLLFGQDASLPEFGQDGIEVSRITVEDKQRILEQLDALNVNAKSVYPSIDQTAVHLRNFYREPERAPSGSETQKG